MSVLVLLRGLSSELVVVGVSVMGSTVEGVCARVSCAT